MARYYFHIHQNGRLFKDTEGSELDSLEKVRAEAMYALPEIAKDEVPQDGDRQAFAVLVTDEQGKPIYSATLTFAGLWLS
jgi:hypothetical protein